MKPKITIVSIGFGDPDLLNEKTVRAMETAGKLVLRTGRHRIVSWLNESGISFSSLDFLYEEAGSFDELDSSVSAYLWAMAAESEVVYAVSDPLTDQTVRALFLSKPGNGTLETVPGVGMADCYLPMFFPLLQDRNLRILSAEEFLRVPFDPGENLLITEIDHPLRAGDVKLRLSAFLSDERELLFMRDESSCARIRLFELDRQPEYDHRSSVFSPSCPLEQRDGYSLNDLEAPVRRKLTAVPPAGPSAAHLAAVPSLTELADQCRKAMESNDSGALRNRLGELVVQSLYHAYLAENCDEFTVSEMIGGLFREFFPDKPGKYG